MGQSRPSTPEPRALIRVRSEVPAAEPHSTGEETDWGRALRSLISSGPSKASDESAGPASTATNAATQVETLQGTAGVPFANTTMAFAAVEAPGTSNTSAATAPPETSEVADVNKSTADSGPSANNESATHLDRASQSLPSLNTSEGTSAPEEASAATSPAPPAPSVSTAAAIPREPNASASVAPANMSSDTAAAGISE